MGRFREIMGFGRNGAYGNAMRGQPLQLGIQTAGNAILPGLGTLGGYLYGNYRDRKERGNHVAYSPDPSAQGNIGNELGISQFGNLGYASPAGQYGPMAAGYAGLMNPQASQQNTYDPSAAENIVNGYMPADHTPAYNGPVPVPGTPVAGQAFGNGSGVFDGIGQLSNGLMGAINGYGPSSGMASRVAGGMKRVRRDTQDVSTEYA